MADMRRYAGGGTQAGGHDQAKRPTAFGGMAVDYSSGFATLVPTPEEARRAQEAERRSLPHDSRRTRIADAWMNDPWFPRTLVQHAEILRNWPTSPNGAAAKEAYMKAAGIVYADGDLFWATDLEAQKPASPPNDAQPKSIAQMPRSPGALFSRETVCAIIRGQMAITHDSHLRDLLTIFESLE